MGASTHVEVFSPKDGLARITLLTVLGQEVATIWTGRLTAGSTIQQPLAALIPSPGTWFLRAEVAGTFLLQRLVVLP